MLYKCFKIICRADNTFVIDAFTLFFWYWVPLVFITAVLLTKICLYSWETRSVELSGCIGDGGGLALGTLVRCGLVDQEKGSEVSGLAIYIPFYPFLPFGTLLWTRSLILALILVILSLLTFCFLSYMCSVKAKSKAVLIKSHLLQFFSKYNQSPQL